MRISDWSSDVCSSDLRSFRHLAEGADHLRVSAMADEQDVPPLRHHLFGLAVNLGDKRAGGVQIFKTARRRGFRDRFRYAMRRQDARECGGTGAQMLGENGYIYLQHVKHIAVNH